MAKRGQQIVIYKLGQDKRQADICSIPTYFHFRLFFSASFPVLLINSKHSKHKWTKYLFFLNLFNEP